MPTELSGQCHRASSNTLVINWGDTYERVAKSDNKIQTNVVMVLFSLDYRPELFSLYILIALCCTSEDLLHI
jgi:hypothetical protein